jgi:polysaccharide pyruvyl transferase WcaK-like protein
MSVTIEQLPDPVLIVGAYGYRNLGDEAILSGLLTRLGPRPVTAVSRDPDGTSRLHGVATIGLRGAASALRRHGSLLIGGGGLFGRDMGRIGRLLPAYALAAHALQRSVAIEGVDLDERLAPSARLLVPQLMRRAERVTVRDRRSAAILRSWGVSANLAPDVSSWMRAASPEAGRAVLRAAGADLRRPIVGLALSGVRPEIAEAASGATLAAMDALPDVQFCFLPMSRHPFVPQHDDLNLARRLRERRPRLLVVEDDLHPATMLAAFGQLSAAVAMRYHAMLFASRMGVPLVPVVYAEKNLRWLSERHLEPIEAAPSPLTAALWSALATDERAVPHHAPVRRMVAVT